MPRKKKEKKFPALEPRPKEIEKTKSGQPKPVAGTKKLWGTANIPSGLLDYDFSSFNKRDPKNKTCKTIAIGYIEQGLYKKHSLMFTGNSGLSGTILGIGILKEFMLRERFKEAYYIHAHELPIKYYKQQLSFGDIDFYDLLLNAELVILDGLGEEPNIAKKLVSVVKTFITLRNYRKRKTVIITHLEAGEMEKVFGQIFSNFGVFELGNPVLEEAEDVQSYFDNI